MPLNSIYIDAFTPDALIEKAEIHKKKNDYDRAILYLRKAFDLNIYNNIKYPIDTYLKLPIYLNKSGKIIEAWEEFQKLRNNILNATYELGLNDYFDLGTIDNQILIYLRRKRKRTEALYYALYAYISNLNILILRKNIPDFADVKKGTIREIHEMIDPNYIIDYISHYLRNTEHESKISGISSMLVEAISSSPNNNYSDIEKKLSIILGANNN